MHKQFLKKWLRDAYAMEKTGIEILERQVNKLDDYPQARKVVQKHIEESIWQADQIDQCLKKLGTSPSGFKDLVGRMSGNISGFTNAMADDETLKSFITDSSFEHLEIASYRALIAAAEEYGEPEIKSICEKILSQEQAMAQWWEDNIQAAMKQFLTNQPVAH